MSLQEHDTPEEEALDKIIHNELLLESIAHNVDPLVLCHLLITRSSGELFNKYDKETVETKEDSSQKVDQILDFLKDRLHLKPAFYLLDCLRCTSLSSSLPLPVKRTFLWFTPSPEYAAMAVHTVETSNHKSAALQPFFWPLRHSPSPPKGGYLYHVCNIFISMDTQLVLVFPESKTTDEEIWGNIVTSCTEQWRNTDIVILYSGLCVTDNINTPQSSTQPPPLSSTASANLPPSPPVPTPLSVLSGPLIFKTSFCTEGLIRDLKLKESRREDSWSRDSFDEISDEIHHHRQSLWLRRLLLEIDRVRNGDRSQWLQDLEWGEVKPSLTEYQKKLLADNLSLWKSGELKEYLVTTREWMKKDDSLLGVVPSAIENSSNILQSIEPAVCHPLPIPNQLTFSVKDELPANVPVLFKGLRPTLVTSAVLPAHLATLKMRCLATRSCCKLTLECLLIHIDTCNQL
ncbi:PREDICTED: uncharacterized protein LOC109590337 [Amphimedon queenslandica]|uniref:Uncharacterized protein n=1 Tax=Amphimedon queenslandica TaxID=400682 RepID=A0A1X7T1G6_AMPQE|nr:PREDICTED: uncharacterized protein LOC109590337 [Amphimedon queenslandica]|eukprot:XP_019861808.1 PREDICTED: uncharacterized protein LOC109590337 [Amphimedon queenslandica]